LGEIPLFAVRLAGVANRRHFSSMEALATPPQLPADVEGENFIFYPCYPVAFRPSKFARVGEWIAYTPYTFRNYYVDFRRITSFDAYLKCFSSKSRSTLQRKVKKFSAASGGEIQFCAYRTADEIEEFLRYAKPLSAKTYQEALLKSGLPQDTEFARHVIALGEEKLVRGFLLFLNGTPAAYAFSFCRDRIMTYDYVGYDPKLAALSPGTVLQYQIFRTLFAEGSADIFDFTEGEGQQKALFATDYRDCAKTYYLRRSLRHLLLVWFHSFLNDIVETAGSALERLHLKSAIRRLIRRAA
jgi:hypothetical protein